MSEELKPELLPCPFCGSDDTKVKFDDECVEHGEFYISCGVDGDCKVFVIAATEAEAIAAWNRRAIPEGQRDAVIEEAAKILMNAKVSALAMSLKTTAGERDAWESACVAIMHAEVAIREMKGKS